MDYDTAAIGADAYGSQASCPFRIDSPRSFPEWPAAGGLHGPQFGSGAEFQFSECSSSDLDSDEKASLADAALETCSVERRARHEPAPLELEADFDATLQAQSESGAAVEASDEAVCAAFFAEADAAAGQHVRSGSVCFFRNLIALL